MSSNNSLYENFMLNGSKCKYPQGLYLVGTPIGNMEDISFRALYTLNKVDFIACEDTRVTKALLTHFGIQNQLVTYNDAKGDVDGRVKQALLDGKRVALVSDAGMPLISDPGYKLVEFAKENDIYVTCIPGPSAVLTALTLSGLASHEFTFKGFFPKKDGETQRLLAGLAPDHTYIFFESPHRIQATLGRVGEASNITHVAIARELTKAFEEVISGTPKDIINQVDQMTLKGEFVLLLRTCTQEESKDDLDREIRYLLQEESVKTVVDIMRERTSLPKKQLYHHVLEISKMREIDDREVADD